MILYVDSSAIVKRYVAESGSNEMQTVIEQAEAIGTTTVSRAEVVAAFRKAVRIRAIAEEDARIAVRNFSKDWRDLVRTRITEGVVEHAADLAWRHGLRGYDSIQLASAAAWQQSIRRDVTFATFDLQLWETTRKIGLLVFPENLPESYLTIRSAPK
jgi:predicted nucleic acid-binding protein